MEVSMEETGTCVNQFVERQLVTVKQFCKPGKWPTEKDSLKNPFHILSLKKRLLIKVAIVIVCLLISIMYFYIQGFEEFKSGGSFLFARVKVIFFESIFNLITIRISSRFYF